MQSVHMQLAAQQLKCNTANRTTLHERGCFSVWTTSKRERSIDSLGPLGSLSTLMTLTFSWNRLPFCIASFERRGKGQKVQKKNK